MANTKDDENTNKFKLHYIYYITLHYITLLYKKTKYKAIPQKLLLISGSPEGQSNKWLSIKLMVKQYLET